MTNHDLSTSVDALVLRDASGASATFPALWLRDNCPSGLHPQTGERLFDLLSVPGDPAIAASRIEDGTLQVQWADGHQSRFGLEWLLAHRPGRRVADPAAPEQTFWRGDLGTGGIPRHAADAILTDDGALLAWMRDAARVGLTIVDGVADRVGAGVEIAERIGFLRRTNFGAVFEVINKPDPNNLAYTAHALPLHTDLPNQEVPPGWQFLHCLANEAAGGGSVFADGFAMADALRRTDPDTFALLAEVDIPFRFRDGDTDIRVHRPVVALSATGALREIRWNAHIADAFDMAAVGMPAYYRAYRAFMAMTRDPAYRLALKLRAGEMVVFDNRRVLHGREAFDPSTGYRHLQGCYVDRGEFDSRLRTLASRPR